MTARQSAEQLRDKLPKHTFRAVMHRAKELGTDEDRRRVLGDILRERECAEARDAEREVAT